MDITVVIPVGPFSGNRAWLSDALDSVCNQTLLPTEIVMINDGAVVKDSREDNDNYYYQYKVKPEIPIRNYTPPWRLGVGHAFNFGVALAKNECVFMLGSDDTLEPTCLQECANTYIDHSGKDYYYSVPIRYMSDGRVQQTPCNAAMVTKGLWKLTGGFPIEATTAPDAALLSIMMVHMPERIIGVRAGGLYGYPLYNYRDHQDTDTKQHGAWHASNVIVETRNLLTKEWRSPEWTQNFI